MRQQRQGVRLFSPILSGGRVNGMHLLSFQGTTTQPPTCFNSLKVSFQYESRDYIYTQLSNKYNSSWVWMVLFNTMILRENITIFHVPAKMLNESFFAHVRLSTMLKGSSFMQRRLYWYNLVFQIYIYFIIKSKCNMYKYFLDIFVQ